MKKKDFEIIISLLLLLSLILTFFFGLIQSQLELRRFAFHQYFAWATIFFGGIHTALNLPKIFKYLKNKFRKFTEQK